MGWFKSACSKVCGAAKTIAKKVATGVSNACSVVKKGASKVYGIVTGKENFDKAKELYQKIQSEIEAADKDYTAFSNQISKDIQSAVTGINSAKKDLIASGFNRFINITSRIAAWEVVINQTSEEFEYKRIKIDGMKNKEDLFLIDFDEHIFKSNLKALVSLGFWSRKEAKETLHKVQEQEKVVEHEIVKIAAEKKRLNLVLESLTQIERYFSELTQSYSLILDELGYAVNLVSASCHIANPAYHSNKIDCYFMPEGHLHCLMAAEKMTRILHEMARLNYLGENGTIIDSDQAHLRESRKTIQNITLKLAA
jgi:hypothetical protein